MMSPFQFTKTNNLPWDISIFNTKPFNVRKKLYKSSKIIKITSYRVESHTTPVFQAKAKYGLLFCDLTRHVTILS